MFVSGRLPTSKRYARRYCDREYHLNANLSGTTIRFLLALAAIVPGKKTILGRGRLNERPIAHLVESLQQLALRLNTAERKVSTYSRSFLIATTGK